MKRKEQQSKNTSTDNSSKNCAVIYCRVSTKEQVDNLSLGTQEKRCRDYCKDNGISVDKVFIEEGESAKTALRPEFQKMLTFCRENRGQITHLVVYSVSRFARQAYDHHSVKLVLAKLGVVLRSVTEPIDESPTGKLMENVLADFAQFDNDVRSERTSVGMIAAVEIGRWVWQAPVGYTRPEGPSAVSMEPHPEKAPLIHLAFEMMATGAYSSQQVLGKLKALGLTTKTGKPLTNQTFSRMLRNPLYRGRIILDRWNLDVQGDFEPIVDDATFFRTQAILEGKTTGPASFQKINPDFPLRGFVRCGSCGSPLTGGYSKGRSNSYPYYHCWKKDCRNVSVRSEVLEAAFVEELSRVQPTKPAIRLFKEVMEDVWAIRQTESLELQGRLSRRLEALEKRRDALESALLYDRTITKETYSRQSTKLSGEIGRAETELQNCIYNQVDLTGLLDQSTKLLGSLKSSWMTRDHHLKRSLQAAIYPEGVSYTSDGLRTAVTSSIFKVLQGIDVGDSHLATPTGFEPVFQP